MNIRNFSHYFRQLKSISAIIVSLSTVPLADARAQLSKMIEEVSSTHGRFEITRNGYRAAVLFGADDYDAIFETIAVLSDTLLLEAHKRGLEGHQEGDTLGAEELRQAMIKSGRRVVAR
ncbi:type II toxin-antitoxin system Phd/YefM family antitoxin [Acidithrix ferrooxidans]|uniref:type II toxin-antitoxin system Phd/YefM family antitoxin n=1 Tax=Acidithrix ferrooxidans TaxID=1280514 RepID=UPI00190F5757|nr:type II toxin-antitoxin system Phd/YefM family antitoxin [Acidithrix ferrooxidans]